MTANGSVQECLFEGLRALREDRDPLLAGLEAARTCLQARRGVWVAASHREDQVAICEDTGLRRLAELPRDFPPRWLEDAPEGRSRLLGPNWLRRDPRAVAAEIEWALVAQSPRTRGRLWFDSTGPLQVDSAWVGDLLAALEHLEELADRRATETRNESLARLGERAAGVAHDLRNQLNLVQLEYRRARLDDSVDSGGPHTESGLGRGLEHAVELCRDFLADGRARRQVSPLRPLLVDEIRAASTLSSRSGEVRLALRCPAALQAVYEPKLLSRILRNLLLNAISATPSGGSVKLEADAEESGTIRITVSDEGRGMNRKDLERLLRAGESRGGTGFGTSSVLACVERLAADLEVESKPAAGTKFVLRLLSR